MVTRSRFERTLLAAVVPEVIAEQAMLHGTFSDIRCVANTASPNHFNVQHFAEHTLEEYHMYRLLVPFAARGPEETSSRVPDEYVRIAKG